MYPWWSPSAVPMRLILTARAGSSCPQNARKRAATTFKLEWAEMEDRHHLTFEAYEVGKLTLEEYLSLTIFYEKRPFTRAQFRRFMFAQSTPYPEMIELVRKLKTMYVLKIAVVSNEGCELNAYRICTFKLDAFISSCFVHLRKPINARLLRLKQSPGAEERAQEASANSKQREEGNQKTVTTTTQEGT